MPFRCKATLKTASPGTGNTQGSWEEVGNGNRGKVGKQPGNLGLQTEKCESPGELLKYTDTQIPLWVLWDPSSKMY